jgi:hypothetical protein
MSKNYTLFPPIMEGIFGEDLRFSIDFGSESAPGGSISFFEKYGYIVIEGLGRIPENEESSDRILNVLSKYLNFKLEKSSYYGMIFTNKNIDSSLPKYDIVVCSQNNSNLKLVPIYVTTKNKQNHCVNLEPGRIIIYDKSVKIKRYNPNMNIFHRWLNKLIPNQYYFYQSFFNYNIK